MNSRTEATNTEPLELICITTLFPNKANERHGIFIYNRLKNLIEHSDVKVHVIAPFPLRSTAALSRDISSEKDAIFESVSRPRFLSIPILNRYLSFIFIALAALPCAIRIVRKSNIKIIDSHFLYPDSVSAGIVSKLLKLPFLNTARGSDINYWASKPFPRYFIKRAMIAAKYNFAVSNKLAKKMRLIAPNANIATSPNGVDNRVFNNNQRESPTQKPYLILSVGNLIPLKGHHLVIEAIANIPDVTLEIIGQGPEKESLVRKVTELKIKDKVTFLNNVSQTELAYKYQNAHALVLASEMEGMPNVVLEAMSCGLQVICTAVGDIPEILSEEYGWVVNRDSPSIKEAISSSISHPKNSKTISQYAEDTFSWENTISNYYKRIKS